MTTCITYRVTMTRGPGRYHLEGNNRDPLGGGYDHDQPEILRIEVWIS